MTKPIAFTVDVHSEIAVYRQIENQVMFAIAGGAYQSGDPLPSVREMAASTGVNANTVTKAYRDLEVMKLIVTRRGVGVQVAPNAAKSCRANTLEMVRRHLRMAVGEGLASGMADKEIKATVQEALLKRVPAYEPNSWS
jgi:GntR family transcriptional regulator